MKPWKRVIPAVIPSTPAEDDDDDDGDDDDYDDDDDDDNLDDSCDHDDVDDSNDNNDNNDNDDEEDSGSNGTGSGGDTSDDSHRGDIEDDIDGSDSNNDSNDDGSSRSEASGNSNETYNVKQKRCLNVYFSVLRVFANLFGKMLSRPTKDNLKRNAIRLARSLKPPYPVKMGPFVTTLEGNGLLLKKKSVQYAIALDRFLTAISLQESELFTYMTAKKSRPFTAKEKRAISILVKHLKLKKSNIPFKKVKLLCN